MFICEDCADQFRPSEIVQTCIKLTRIDFGCLSHSVNRLLVRNSCHAKAANTAAFSDRDFPAVKSVHLNVGARPSQ